MLFVNLRKRRRMGKFVFLFNLDSVVLKEDLLYAVARETGYGKELEEHIGRTMRGEVPFKQSYLECMELLKDVRYDQVNEIATSIGLNKKIVEFIRENSNRCFVFSDNLDAWIGLIVRNIGIEQNTFSPKAILDSDGRVQDIISVLDRKSIINQMVMPYVAIGDSNNDTEMIAEADVGIAYGGTRMISPSVLEYASHAVYTEERLVYLLKKLL